MSTSVEGRRNPLDYDRPVWALVATYYLLAILANRVLAVWHRAFD